MSRFNLIDENWIPVRFLDGSRGELGIQETFLRAKEIATIEDPSPLVVAGLHRFLLAVLYRALEGPTDIDQAKKLFRDGLPSEKINAYLEKWRDRFWLFDDAYPFYQVPGFIPTGQNQWQWRSWSALAAEHNADNAKVLFDHLDVTDSGAISSSRAACWLLACQTFALGGGRSPFQYTRSAPSAAAVIVLPLGKDLHDTLIISLVPENREVLPGDIPVWEREPEALESLQKGMERPVSGWVDLYTWRTRSIRFNCFGEESRVRELAFASGVAWSSEGFVDPMLAYKIREEKGRQYVRFGERGLWRDFHSLLPDNGNLAPKVIEHATALTKSNRDRFPRSVMVLGQANDQAKIEFWRMERFALPEALAGDRFIRTEVEQLLTAAEDAQRALWAASRSFARDVLSRGGGKPDGEAVKGFVKQIAVSSWYWSALEARFHEILREYSLDRESDDIRLQWIKSLRNTVNTAWDKHRNSVSMGDAWAIRALVKAEGPIRAKLRELNEEISKLTPAMEKA